jgi:hypothetical protein
MTKLTADQARAGSMTIEEAGEATYWRALQIEGALTGLMCRQSSSFEEWQSMFTSMTETRPWMHLPSEQEPYGDLYSWLGAKFKVGDVPMTRKHLVAIVDAYHPGSGKQVVANFEQKLDQPYVRVGEAHRPKGSKNGAPGPSKQRGQNNVDVLMARLRSMGVDVLAEIGEGKRFASAAEAARHYGITKPRSRYEISPSVNLDNAAQRIIEVLGADKAAELVAHLTTHLTK